MKPLSYRAFTGTQNLIPLSRLLEYPGPVTVSCGERFGETFAQYVGVRRQFFRELEDGKYCSWTVEIEYGEFVYVSPKRIWVNMGRGIVKYDFASQLIDALNDCLQWWEEHVGDAGSVPECQNPEHGEISRLVSEPECVPDGEAWICLGCGWRVNAEGLKLTQKLFPEDNQRPARKAGSQEHYR